MEAPNLDTPRMPGGGLHLVSPERLEEDGSINVAPSITKRIFRASAVFLFLALIGVGGAVAWRSLGGDQATDMFRALIPPVGESTSRKPASPSGAAAEIQQQLASAALNIAAVKQTLERLTTNQDQLARKQEQMAQSIATLQAAEQELSERLSSAAPHKTAEVPLPIPRPMQRPAPLSTGTLSKPAHAGQPQSLQPPAER